MGVGGFKAVGRPPAPLTTEGDSLPSQGEGRGGVGGGFICPLWGPRLMPLAVQCSGGRVATVWGDAGREREARAEGRRPGGAGGGLAPQEAARPCVVHPQAEVAAVR